MTAARRPTLADVAAAAGVSRATASRALGGRPHVGTGTRERVWAAAERLAFEPNQLARSLRRGATMAVGVIVPDVANAFYAAALSAAQETLEAAGYHALVLNTERTAARERAALRSLRNHRVDGLLVASYGGYEDIGVPAVFFDDVPSTPGAGAVALANEQGVTLLVEHLVKRHGARRIAYLGAPEAAADAPPPLVFSGRERLDGFRAAIGRAGLALPPELVASSAVTRAGARTAAARLLALAEPPEAVVAGTDVLAAGVIDAARERGERVGADLALVSFDEPLYADLIDPPVTALDRHDRELGRRAAELLLAALAGAPAADAVERVAFTLNVRRSCGCGAEALF